MTNYHFKKEKSKQTDLRLMLNNYLMIEMNIAL